MYKFFKSRVKKRQQTPQDSEIPNRWFTLPREIRDLIYREVLCKSYLIQWPVTWKQGKSVSYDDRPLFWFRGRQCYWRSYSWSGHIWMKRRPVFWADVALLLSSKAISLEAIEIMYEGSLFCVNLMKRPERWYPMTPPPSQQVLACVRNLEIGVCLCEIDDVEAFNFMACDTWLKKFNDTDIKRNTCRISFSCHFCSHWCQFEEYTRFLRACHSLLGFKTLTIEIYNTKRQDLQAALEPHLGPRFVNFGLNLTSLEPRLGPQTHVAGTILLLRLV